MKPPVRLLFSLFANIKPILETMNDHTGVFQSVGKPDIVEKEIDGKTRFIVVEKTAFNTRKDAEIFISIGARVQSFKLWKI